MNKFKLLWLCAVLGLMVGCAKGSNGLPYDGWRLGLGALTMEVWIETADAVDVRDRVFKRAMSGVAAIKLLKTSRATRAVGPAIPVGAQASMFMGQQYHA
jgi:hypothetical protein